MCIRDRLDGKYILNDKVTWEQEKDSALETVYKNGLITKEYSLQEIRERLQNE